MEEVKSEIINRTIRARKEDLDRLAELGREDFKNQPEALEALINLYDIQRSKDAIPDRKADISDFDSHLQALSRAYLHSLDLATNADARALDTVRAKLESKDSIIQQLQERVAALQLQLGDAEAKANDAAARTDAAAQKVNDLQAALDAAHTQARTLEASLNDKARIIDALNLQIAEITRRADANAQAADRAIELQAARDAAEAETVRLQNQAEINKALADMRLTQAVADAQRDAAAQILDLTQRNATLNVELATLKATVATQPAPNAATVTDPAPMGDQRTPTAAEPEAQPAPAPKRRSGKKANSPRNKQPAPKQEEREEKKAEPKEIPGLKDAKDLINAWADYRQAFRHSFEGEDAVGGMTDPAITKPTVTVEEYLKDYPAAAAYLEAEEESRKTNYELAHIGKRALDRIAANPDDYTAAIEQMHTDISAFADHHIWD